MAPPQPLVTSAEAGYDGYRTTELSCPGTGPTIVLLHGLFDRAQSWSPLLDRLAAAGRRAVAVGVPQPHERTPGTAIVPRQDRFVAAVVRAHSGTSGVVLVGNSMGGALAVRAAADPELNILAVAALDMAGFDYMPWASVLVGPRGLPEWLLRRVVLPQRPLEPLARWVIERTLFAQPSPAAAAEARHFARVLAQVPIGLGLSSIRALLTELDTPFTAPRCPTLLVHGRRDVLVPVSASRRAHERFPGSELHIFPDSGHVPQIDEPGRTCELILDFADRMRPAA